MSDGDHFTMLPSWEDMDFGANCDAWGEFVSSFTEPSPWDPKSGTVVMGGYMFIFDLFMESVPNGTAKTGEFGALNAADQFVKISEWYSWNLINSLDVVTPNSADVVFDMEAPFFQNLWVLPSKKCQKEACSALREVGNTDLTGVSIYVSYYFEATLATLYLFAFTLSYVKRHFKTKNSKGDHQPLPKGTDKIGVASVKPKVALVAERALDAFRGSLDSFLASAMLFSISMLCAAIYISAAAQKSNSSPFAKALISNYSSTYDMILSLSAAAFSVFPVMVLYALMGRRDGRRGDRGRTSHRTWLRRAVVLIIWVLLVAEVYISPRGNADYGDRHAAIQSADVDPCNKRGGTQYWRSMKAAEVLVIGVPILWALATTFLMTGFRVPGMLNKPWVRRCRSIWDLAIAWANMVLSWAILGFFSALRAEIRETAGKMDKSDQWGFGQVLSLATWVPIVLEFLYLFIFGIEDGLNTRMPPEFEVHPVGRREDHDLGAMTYQNPYQQGAIKFGSDPYEQVVDADMDNSQRWGSPYT